ncbi:hypothetical protein HYH03_003169 [Edaphochlamys debaryana]|uniref:Plastid lipid-associated protein/fibrillin conserved domain-containing protein n=1 Tax=Edaphochlamys debaryana TaxID=47281 RepID=A0A835YCE4_9CHLO|nr:hypothetical protein HYH03_003169 [Edaphochlamys debaryana]|eukprot:KAG2498982.1 hypothetical protein HYH03_003169 [Edaphochlamys debaryana]
MQRSAREWNARRQAVLEDAGANADLAATFRRALDFGAAKVPASPPIAAMPTSPSATQPLATLADQVLTGSGHDDPVAAAKQLQAFLAQYRDQYGPETDARIGAAMSKLQEYINGYSGGAGGGGADRAGLMDALGGAGGLLGALGSEGAGDAGAAARDAAAQAAPEYHNYILENLTAVLDWVNNLLIKNGPKPYVYDSFGRIVQDPNAASSLEQQQEQLKAASASLRVLIQQLSQVNQEYASMADSEEKVAMGQVLQQLTTMADRLAVAATRRPVPGGLAEGALDLAPYVPPEQVYGVDKYRDPLLKVLDGVYQALVVDSGLREFLVGVKQLGDSLATSMAVAWTGAPPVGRLVAYIAAVAGVVFVMRTKLPQSLLESPRRALSRLTGGAMEPPSSPTASSSTSSLPPPPTSSSPFAAPGSAAATPPASAGSAAAFAAISKSGGSRVPPPLPDQDGGRAVPQELLQSLNTAGQPYAMRKLTVEPAPSQGASGVAGGLGAAAGGAQAAQASARSATATAVAPSPTGGSGSGSGHGAGSRRAASGWGTVASASTTAASAAAPPAPPPGGWTAQYSDRSDWWTAGQQASASTSSPPPPPPPPPPAPFPRTPRTVAESWEQFRRTTETNPVAVASGSPYAGGGGSGSLDTAAALAAAAVAAAAASSGTSSADPRMTEYNRASAERRFDKDKARLRATIKERLKWVCRALGPVSSVVPGGEPLRDEVDGLLAQLEALAPTDKPLNVAADVATRRTTAGPVTPVVDPALLGEWRLVYASNAGASAGMPSAATQAASGGPNLLAQILQLADSLPGFGMTHVLQRLELEAPSAAAASGGAFAGVGRTISAAQAQAQAPPPPAIVTENSAVFRFGPLGSWKVTVRGRWTDNGGGLCATAEFESFSVRPVDLWGLPVEQLLPEVTVPVPDILRTRSEWCTTYLDEDMRIGRGSGGALFLFKKGGLEADPAVVGGPWGAAISASGRGAVAAGVGAGSIGGAGGASRMF